MIWIWLSALLSVLVDLVIPPKNRAMPVISPNAQCPACGNSKGKIACVANQFTQSPDMQHKIQHTCAVCGASWFENTVVKKSIGYLIPSNNS